jgi:hypothetical protein
VGGVETEQKNKKGPERKGVFGDLFIWFNYSAV